MPSASSTSRLCRSTNVDAVEIEPPDPSCLDLPEKILQFGTGAFLRAFSDVFVDRANRMGTFDGRIVVVGSTRSGRSRLLNEQDGLYTICVRGVENGGLADRCEIIGSVSRAIASTEDWDAVVELARSPQLEFVFSNTTEVGIRLDADDRRYFDPPRSFPGKLTALLHERAEAFDYDPDHGLIVLCCELIEDNAYKLREIVLELADRWALGHRFSEWVRTHNRFLNTLVDRIVPGTPDKISMQELEKRLGYSDSLLVQAEPYSLWAIEGDDSVRERLPFVNGNPSIIIVPDITPYRLRKVRILNGAHTLIVPVSLLCGNDTVAETMEDSVTSVLVRSIMLHEIVPSLDLPGDEAASFAHQVLDRFANPFVRHKLVSIALQQTSKMDVRVVPSLIAYYEKTGRLPRGIALAFAAYLQFMTGDGRVAELELPEDDRAATIRGHWEISGKSRLEDFVARVCADGSLWHHPLTAVPGFVGFVAERVSRMRQTGVKPTIEAYLHEMDGAGAESGDDLYRRNIDHRL